MTASGKLDYQAQISSHSFEGNLTDCQITKAWQMRRKLSQAILCYSFIMSIYKYTSMTYNKENCQLHETSCSSGNARRKILRFCLLYLFFLQRKEKQKDPCTQLLHTDKNFLLCKLTNSRETIRAIHSAQKLDSILWKFWNFAFILFLPMAEADPGFKFDMFDL